MTADPRAPRGVVVETTTAVEKMLSYSNPRDLRQCLNRVLEFSYVGVTPAEGVGHLSCNDPSISPDLTTPGRLHPGETVSVTDDRAKMLAMSAVARIYLLYQLPNPVIVEPAALGSRVQTSIAGVDAQLHLPRWPADGSDALASPDFRHPGPLREGWSWGTAGGIDEEGDAAWVEAVAFTSNVTIESARGAKQTTESVVRRLSEGLWDWALAISEWIEVLFEQDLDSTSRLHFAHVPIVRAECVIDGTRHDLKPPTRIHFRFDIGRPVTRAAWRKIVQLVGSSTRPSPAHLVLRNARAALRRDHTRQAVLEAGTVLESALWDLLRGQHAANPSPLGQAFLREAERASLGRLLGMARESGLSIPLAFSNDVVAVRNTVAHKQARTPSRDEAERVVGAATETLAVTSPRPRWA